MSDTTKKFWMVLRDGGDAPMHRHGSLLSATKEAERLASQVRGGRFFVLEAVAVVQEKRTTTTWLDADAERQFNAEDNDVPF